MTLQNRNLCYAVHIFPFILLKIIQRDEWKYKTTYGLVWRKGDEAFGSWGNKFGSNVVLVIFDFFWEQRFGSRKLQTFNENAEQFVRKRTRFFYTQIHSQPLPRWILKRDGSKTTKHKSTVRVGVCVCAKDAFVLVMVLIFLPFSLLSFPFIHSNIVMKKITHTLASSLIKYNVKRPLRD